VQITRSRSIDLECDTAEQRDWMLQGWKGILAAMKRAVASHAGSGAAP